MVTQAIPVAELRDQARKVRPGLAVATAILAVFVAAGWVIGRVIDGLISCGLAVRYGYRLGRRMLPAAAEAQASPPPNPRL
jgi:TRAP-type mannitol/chloroaromatic compound transport system permease large subunit